MRNIFADYKREPWFWGFLALALSMLVAMLFMSNTAGNSGDEDKFQIPQGKFVMDYYKSDGQDKTCMQDVVTLNGKEQNWNLKYYGCSFDVVTEWINETLGLEDIARTRHNCNALLGWLIVLFGGLIAYQAGKVSGNGNEERRGWRAAVVTMLLLFLSPRLLGHSFNNPKDIPFAAGVIMFIYYSMMYLRQMTPIAVTAAVDAKNKNSKGKTQRQVQYPAPAFGKRTTLVMDIILVILSALVLFLTAGILIAILVVGIEVLVLYAFRKAPKFNPLTLLMMALSLALAISNRVGGLIVVCYLGLWALLWMVSNIKALSFNVIAKVVVTAVPVCVTGFFAGLLLWPFAMQDPIHNTLESFKLMSQFDVSLRQLFEGQMLMSDQMPWYYTPKFMLMTIPVAVLLGWVLYPVAGGFKKARWVDSTMIYFTCIFPVFWIVVTGANVYGGWRHSIFTYPTMAVAAGLAYDALAAWAGRKSRKRLVETVVACVPFLLLVPPAVHIVRNHPHEYVYFNELTGGVKKAYGHYEMDYYYHSMRAATEWVMANAEPRNDGEKTLVGSFHIESTKYFLRNDTTNFATRFVRWNQRGEFDWDYLVFPITGISGAELLGPHFPPQECVHTVEVSGVPIALVLKRDNKYDLQGVQLMKKGQIDSAKVLMNKALEANPYNVTALAKLAEIGLQTGQVDSVVTLSQRLLEIDPDNGQAKQLLCYGYLNTGRNLEADQLLAQLRNTGDNPFAYSLSAQLAAQRGDFNSAMAFLNEMLGKGLMDNESLNLYVALSQQNGINPQNAQYNFYAAYARGLEKKGDKKNAEMIRKQLNGGR